MTAPMQLHSSLESKWLGLGDSHQSNRRPAYFCLRLNLYSRAWREQATQACAVHKITNHNLDLEFTQPSPARPTSSHAL